MIFPFGTSMADGRALFVQSLHKQGNYFQAASRGKPIEIIEVYAFHLVEHQAIKTVGAA